MEKSHFWWFCWLGLGNPRHIATKTPLEKLDQNLGLADPPPPQLGQKTKFFQWVYLKAPLRSCTFSRFKIQPSAIQICNSKTLQYLLGCGAGRTFRKWQHQTASSVCSGERTYFLWRSGLSIIKVVWRLFLWLCLCWCLSRAGCTHTSSSLASAW